MMKIAYCVFNDESLRTLKNIFPSCPLCYHHLEKLEPLGLYWSSTWQDFNISDLAFHTHTSQRLLLSNFCLFPSLSICKIGMILGIHPKQYRFQRHRIILPLPGRSLKNYLSPPCYLVSLDLQIISWLSIISNTIGIQG